MLELLSQEMIEILTWGVLSYEGVLSTIYFIEYTTLCIIICPGLVESEILGT